MDRALKVITLELKRKKFIRDIIFSLTGLTVLSFFSYFLIKTLQESELSMVPMTFLQLVPYIILVICSFSLTQEFTNRTDKVVFTGIFTRNEIVFSKLISFLTTSLICYVWYELLNWIVCGVKAELLLVNLGTFLIYAFALGSFILLVSVISSNFIVTGIATYVLYFDLILAIFKQALESDRSEAVKQIIVNLPFYIANTGFSIGTYTAKETIIMLMCGSLFLTVACVIINRKNM